MAKRRPDIRKLAKGQRWLAWWTLLAFFNQPALIMVAGSPESAGGLLWVLAIINLFLVIAGLVLVLLVLDAEGSHPLPAALFGVLMLAPCFSLVAVLLINDRVTRTLRRMGIKVRFMGANMEEVERILNAALCEQCGYDLTGNVSGRCPECGACRENRQDVLDSAMSRFEVSENGQAASGHS